MKRLAFFVLFFAALASAQNQYYVSNSGSDSNSGTSLGSPWKNISHAIATANLTGGAVINVTAGTYAELIGCINRSAVICVNRSGPSTTQRLVVQCSTQWSVPSGSGCLLRNASAAVGIQVTANNVDVAGFDYSNATHEAGIVSYCVSASGPCPLGNSVHVLDNYIHDLATDHCPQFGAIYAGPQNHVPAFQTDFQVVGNRIQHYGDTTTYPRNGGTCNLGHGLYINNAGSIIDSNVIVQVPTYGIQFYSQPCQGVISNNTIDQAGKGDIVIGGGDCSPQGHITLNNNILEQAPSGAIQLGAGGTSPCSASSRVKITNNLIATGSVTNGNLNGCTDVTGTITEAPTATFNGYSASSANNNYALKVGSAARNAGTPAPGCVSGTTYTSCVPSIAFDQSTRPNPPSIGAYDIGGGGCTGGTVTLTPSLIGFGNSLVGVTSNAIPAVLTNTTCGSISIVSTTLGGTNPADFAFTAPGATLASGASVNIPATIKPLALGNRTATLTVTYGAGTMLTINLAGTGVGAPALCYSPASVTFSPQQVGVPSSGSSFTVTNCGNANLTVSALTVAVNPTEFSETDNCGSRPFTLAAGAFCTVNAVFTPNGTGTRNGTVRATDNATGSPQSQPLSGDGFNSIIPPETIMIKGSVVITGGVVIGGPPN